MTWRYGDPPVDLGYFPVANDQHMKYLYLPVKLLGTYVTTLPERCAVFESLLNAAIEDYGSVVENYVYLTVKAGHVDESTFGNRPGWHADGYGSGGDITYIWSDLNPTEFAVQNFVDVPDDDNGSMKAMEAQAKNIVTYPEGHLLKLNEGVVHRVAENNRRSGMRTFVKIAFSKHRFNLKGNSHNYLLDYNWKMHDRLVVRNLDNKDFVND